MWLLLGLGAIIFAILNVVTAFQNKQSKWYGFISLSLTALTLCDFYSDAARRLVNNDMGGLMDTVPILSTFLWVCTIASIIINGIPLFKK